LDSDILKPGLELDKLIAEKVLGWYQDSDIGGPRAWWFKKGDEENIQETPLHLNHYSTDIKAAWDLVEKFKLCVVPWGGQWTATKQGQIFYGPQCPPTQFVWRQCSMQERTANE
jgi:hypothetical protein